MIECIKNGRVIDPSQGIDRIMDVWIKDGRIAGLEEPSSEGRPPGIASGDWIDARGKIVVPGLIDMHVHLREPGYEYKETIRTGTQAAAAGGFTSIACMANTDPVNDHGAITEYILKKAREEGCVDVYPIGAITKGLRGEALSEIGEMKEVGIVALSDDGFSVRNSELLRRAMEYAKGFNLTIISHCEDIDLKGDGVINEGLVSTELGLKGIPNVAEEVIVARDILLSRLTGCSLHIAHVSTAGSVDIIRRAKAEGIKVTAEVTPHHLVLTDEACRDFDTNTKVNPPLRTRRDVDALRSAISDGTIDAISTDHAPHSLVEKEVEFDQAAFGIVGMETAFSITYEMVEKGIISIADLIARWTIYPARILRIEKGTLCKGAQADITIIDLEKEYVIDRNLFRSKGRNTPFHGWKVKGFVEKTIWKGELIYDSSRAMRG
jgi:dihydroorotase